MSVSRTRALVFLAAQLLVCALPDGAAAQGKADRSPRTARKLAVSEVKPAAGSVEGGGEWPGFLGAMRDNVSASTGLAGKWPAKGPRQIGKITGLGVGFSNVAIAGNSLYTMGNSSGRERVLAFSLDDGSPLWQFDNARGYQNGYGDGPRSTPTVDGDRIYALGGSGDLCCLARQDARPVWRVNILREYGGNVPGWGVSESVLIDGDRLICTPGGSKATMVALDKQTGRPLWKVITPERDAAAYSSPIVVDAGGVRQYVQFTSRGTMGVRAEDGRLLWREDSAANQIANCPTPVAQGSLIFSASGYNQGGAVVELASRNGLTTARLRHRVREMQVHHGGLALVDGHVYAATDSGGLTCVELATGRVKWRNRSVGKGSLTCADGRLVVRSERGTAALVEASPAAYRELGRFEPPERSGASAWTYPVVAGGRLYLRDQDLLQIYDLVTP